MRREPQIGSRWVCPGCGTKLEVIGLTPLEVDWAFDEPLAEASSDVLLDDSGADSGLTVVPKEPRGPLTGGAYT